MNEYLYKKGTTVPSPLCYGKDQKKETILEYPVKYGKDVPFLSYSNFLPFFQTQASLTIVIT